MAKQGEASASIVKLCDYRRRRGHRMENLPRQPMVLGRDATPDADYLHRARLIYELAEIWGIDLRLVMAIASGGVPAEPSGPSA